MIWKKTNIWRCNQLEDLVMFHYHVSLQGYHFLGTQWSDSQSLHGGFWGEKMLVCHRWFRLEGFSFFQACILGSHDQLDLFYDGFFDKSLSTWVQNHHEKPAFKVICWKKYVVPSILGSKSKSRVSRVCTLPETNMAPENRPLEVRRFLLETTIFRCYVSFRVLVTFLFLPKGGLRNRLSCLEDITRIDHVLDFWFPDVTTAPAFVRWKFILHFETWQKKTIL